MYESFFGLTGPPFRLIPDPAFLFAGKGHRDAFAALQVGLATGATVIVLTGEVGSGKTTLLQALLASVDPSATSKVHISAAHLDAETLSERFSEALELPPQSDPVARRATLLNAFPSRPRPTLLAIDEAQHLAPSALDLLERLASSTTLPATRLQICLVGQPELRILLNAARRGGFRELIGVDRHLGALEQSEIRLYVEHRLHRAGWTGRPEFEDAAFAEIFIFTAGNPRRVNLLCNSLMLCAYLKKQPRIDAAAVTWAAAAMREDSLQGAPDQLDLASHFERRLTLAEAFEPDAELEARTARVDIRPWSCPNCGNLNAATAATCWNCNVASTSPETASEPPGNPIHSPEETATARPDAPDSQLAMGTHPVAELAARARGDDTSHAVDATDSDPSAMPQHVSRAPRRRAMIFASVASAVVALALLAYFSGQPALHTGLSQSELRDIVGNRRPSPTSPRAAVDPVRRSIGSLDPNPPVQASAPASSSDLASRARGTEAAALRAPQAGDDPREGVDGDLPGPAEVAPGHAVPPTSDAAGGMPVCSGPAFALGLCDTGATSNRRQ